MKYIIIINSININYRGRNKYDKNDPLKVKIRITKSGNSTTPINRSQSEIMNTSSMEDINGDLTNNNNNNINGITNSVSLDKPLKIKIKKDVFNSPTLSGSNILNNSNNNINNNNNNNNSTIIIPTLQKIEMGSKYNNIGKIISGTSEQISELNDKDFNNLKEDIEIMKTKIKEYSNNINSQLELLEQWHIKKENMTINKPVTTTPVTTNIPVTPKENVELPPKRKYKRKKLADSDEEEEDDLFDDAYLDNATTNGSNKGNASASPVVTGNGRRKRGKNSGSNATVNAFDEDSEFEEDIDVVDIDDQEYLDSMQLEMNNNNNSGSNVNDTKNKGKGTTNVKKRNSGVGSGTTSSNRGGSGGPTTSKGRGRQSKNSKNKNSINENKVESKVEENEYNEDISELENLPRPLHKIPPKHNFWIDVEPYFQIYSEEDIKWCAPYIFDPEDIAFVIPPLGKIPIPKDNYYINDTLSNSTSLINSGNNQSLDDSFSGNTGNTSTLIGPDGFPTTTGGVIDEDKITYCGELTQRILSSLIEEKVIHSNNNNNTNITNNLLFNGGKLQNKESKDGILESTTTTNSNENNNEGSISTTTLLNNSSNNSNNNSGQVEPIEIPTNTPLVYDYSPMAMFSLEERIKLELKLLGLIDEEIIYDSAYREDDEICSELRRLQQELRDHVSNCNRIKSSLSETISKALKDQEEERLERLAEDAFEQQYTKSMVCSSLIFIYLKLFYLKYIYIDTEEKEAEIRSNIK